MSDWVIKWIGIIPKPYGWHYPWGKKGRIQWKWNTSFETLMLTLHHQPKKEYFFNTKLITSNYLKTCKFSVLENTIMKFQDFPLLLGHYTPLICWYISRKSSSSIQFWSGFIPVNRGGRIDLTLTAISPTPTLHLTQFMASSFSKTTLLLSFSTYVFHVFFCCPCFLLPFTSNSNAFLKTWPSFLLNTCPYHLTLFVFAIWTTVYFNPNTSKFKILKDSPSPGFSSITFGRCFLQNNKYADKGFFWNYNQ